MCIDVYSLMYNNELTIYLNVCMRWIGVKTSEWFLIKSAHKHWSICGGGCGGGYTVVLYTQRHTHTHSQTHAHTHHLYTHSHKLTHSHTTP